MKYFTYKITDTTTRVNSWDEEKDKDEAIKYTGFCFLLEDELYISQLTNDDNLQDIYLVDKDKLKSLDDKTIFELYEELKLKDDISNRWGILDSYYMYYTNSNNLIDFLEHYNLDIFERDEFEYDYESIKLYKELNKEIDFTSKFGKIK